MFCQNNKPKLKLSHTVTDYVMFSTEEMTSLILFILYLYKMTSEMYNFILAHK